MVLKKRDFYTLFEGKQNSACDLCYSAPLTCYGISHFPSVVALPEEKNWSYLDWDEGNCDRKTEKCVFFQLR